MKNILILFTFFICSWNVNSQTLTGGHALLEGGELPQAYRTGDNLKIVH